MAAPTTPSTPAQRLAAERARSIDEKKRARERQERRLRRSPMEWETELLHAVSQGSIDGISQNLDELPLQVKNGKSALLKGWWMAADKALERGQRDSFDRLLRFPGEHTAIFSAHEHSSSTLDFVFWRRMAAQKRWDWIGSSPFLMAHVWSAREAFSLAFTAQGVSAHRRAHLFETWRTVLSKAAPAGEESRAALSVFKAALDIHAHERTPDSAARLNLCFVDISDESDKEQALRHAALAFSLTDAPELHQVAATQWAFEHGARSQAQTVGHALCLAIERDRIPERLVDLILSEPLDWTQCHALGVALAANRPKMAERLLGLGAPADGPVGAGRDSVALSRIEPLTGAALLFDKSPEASKRWMRLLIQKGANPQGANPLGDDLLKTLERVDTESNPSLPALLALRELDGLRSGAWELIRLLSTKFARSGHADAQGLAQLAAEVFAAHEANGLRKTIAHASRVSDAPGQTDSAAPPPPSDAKASEPRSASRRL